MGDVIHVESVPLRVGQLRCRATLVRSACRPSLGKSAASSRAEKMPQVPPVRTEAAMEIVVVLGQQGAVDRRIVLKRVIAASDRDAGQGAGGYQSEGDSQFPLIDAVDALHGGDDPVDRVGREVRVFLGGDDAQPILFATPPRGLSCGKTKSPETPVMYRTASKTVKYRAR